MPRDPNETRLDKELVNSDNISWRWNSLHSAEQSRSDLAVLSGDTLNDVVMAEDNPLVRKRLAMDSVATGNLPIQPSAVIPFDTNSQMETRVDHVEQQNTEERELVATPQKSLNRKKHKGDEGVDGQNSGCSMFTVGSASLLESDRREQ